jgi:hypothetical protein
MGQVTFDFPGLPADAAPSRATVYAAVYADLTAKGFAVPGIAANVITRAQLLAHLQTLAGQLIKDELNNDPEQLYTGGPTNAQLANILTGDFVPLVARRLQAANVTGYRVVAGTTLTGLVLVQNPSLADPAFLSVPGIDAALVRFRQTATDPLLRGATMSIKLAAANNTLTLDAPLPVVPTVGDILDVGTIRAARLAGRYCQVMSLPFAPNSLTAANVAEAKV